MTPDKLPGGQEAHAALDAITGGVFSFFVRKCQRHRWNPHIVVLTSEHGLPQDTMQVVLWAFEGTSSVAFLRFDIPAALHSTGWKIHAADVLELLRKDDFETAQR